MMKMALKEIVYYEGSGLVYPTRPVKPVIENKDSPTSIRKYADDLEVYTSERAKYDEDLKNHRLTKFKRCQELAEDLAVEYGISQNKANVLFDKAWEDGHSSGVQEVIRVFDELYDIADKFSTTP